LAFMTQHPWTIESSYDQVAQQYTETFFAELDRKPFDRQLLDAFAKRVRHQGLVWDVGCGPGHVARYLKDRGVEVCGVDLSAAMVQCATHRNSDIPFHKGDMRALNFPPASFAGIVAFYSLIHLQRPEVPQALQEFYCVLQAHAPLLLAFHGGTGEVHTENWFRQGVSIDATLFTPEEMTGYLHETGFQVEQVNERDPMTSSIRAVVSISWGAKERPMLTIRPEQFEDIAAIRHVNTLAFGQPNEADLVDALRRAGVLTFSLVAVTDRAHCRAHCL
jgi:ubiquinone/menaquinone biosynthesis C-methylase UbiE